MKAQYTLKEDGFRGIWFEGDKYRDKVIIYMMGAKCGEEDTIQASKTLREEGYSLSLIHI